jgi:uncharacterized protein YdhG (YjbR/CyaY superfamily)
MAERKPADKGTRQSAEGATATGKTSPGFTDEERAAIKERAQELKTEARRGRRADKAEGERAVLAKLAELPEPDRVLGERLHAIITASAPALTPRLWYGMPAYARDGKVVCFSRPRTSSTSAMRPSASATGRSWTTVPCGRPPSR